MACSIDAFTAWDAGHISNMEGHTSNEIVSPFFHPQTKRCSLLFANKPLAETASPFFYPQTKRCSLLFANKPLAETASPFFHPQTKRCSLLSANKLLAAPSFLSSFCVRV
eukprot:TRINITY_DN10068_c0_g1_i1.p3 TRINITY_DN10068_c0_g1~~TRINITY_DN10068_c0_g1_i1.p3  ORF type:complete len:110 (+),score=13.77 TRINITY_DN10068_c0_g1_i1:1909-2238(+)